MPQPSSMFSAFASQGLQSLASTVAVPVRVVFKNGESENSGSSYVTPQQTRRRRPLHHPHHRRNRKVSAPPELQAHLGTQKSLLPAINLISSIVTRGGGSPNHDAVETASTTEFVINLNNSNKLGLPEGLNSGSDSGVPSEYSSWAAPVARNYNSSPYEDHHLRSISASLDDIPNSGNLRRDYISDSEDEDMSSPQPSHRTEGINNAGYVNSETQQQQPIALPAGPSSQHPTPPHPFNRAQTDTNLLSSHSTLPGSVTPQRARTNSMVFQLNLANGLPGSNTLPNGRSVSMISLNTAGNGGPNIPITYPNLSSFNNDTQSVYSDAGLPHNYTPGLLGLGNNMGSQGSLSGVGYGPSGNAHHNYEDDHQFDEPQATDPAYKDKWFIDTLCENLSTMYAILLFMVGCVLYLADTFSHKNSAMGEVFNVYLIIVQLLWLGYIHVDVRKYINNISTALEEAGEKGAKGDPVQLESTPDGQYQLRINLPEPRKTFPQDYGFTTGRHGGSLYLKIGAAVFCLGYLIHSGLNLGQKILYIVEEDPAFDSCTCAQDVLMSVLQPIYAFYQLFFIFKYSNLIINRRKRVSRFALMHCISASLLFWVYTIIQETLQAINSKKEDYPTVANNITATPSYRGTSPVIGEDMDSDEDMDDGDSESYGYATSYTSDGLKVNYGCGKTTTLTKMINDTTPYLYPFSIEYNILIVGIWILLWENIGRMDRHTHLPSIEMTYEDDNTKGITSNLIIYVDCHSSNRGLFAGLLLTVATIISIILFFILTASDDAATKLSGLQVNGYSELIILIVMGVVAVLAYLAIRNLDIVKSHVSSVDDILLYICLPCIFLYAVFSMVPAFTYGKPLFVAVSIVQVIQAVIQTALICDGLRRCSNTAALNSKKPGREMITFMVVANLALWLLETFEIKSEDGNYYKYDFYGKEAWTLLSHMTLPLALFYRFHSSVCLVDIWKAGYESEPEH